MGIRNASSPSMTCTSIGCSAVTATRTSFALLMLIRVGSNGGKITVASHSRELPDHFQRPWNKQLHALRRPWQPWQLLRQEVPQLKWRQPQHEVQWWCDTELLVWHTRATRIASTEQNHAAHASLYSVRICINMFLLAKKK